MKIEARATGVVGVVGDVTKDRRKRTDGSFLDGMAGTKKLVHSRWRVYRELWAFPKRPKREGKPVLGGDPANVALSRSKLGEDQVVLFSTVGRGAYRFVKRSLKENNVVPVLKRHFKIQPAGYIVVNHNGEKNRAIISVKPRGKIPQKISFEGFNLSEIYLTSVVGKNWGERYDAVTEYAKEHNDVFLAVAPGSVQMKDRGPALYRAIERANALLVNREEAMKIVGLDDSRSIEVPELLDRVQKLGSENMMVLITDDTNGSFVKDAAGNKFHAKAQLIPEDEMGSSLGAGDGYSAAFLQAIAEGLSIPEAMVWGTLNASSIIRTTDAHSGQLKRDQMRELVAGHHGVEVEMIAKGAESVQQPVAETVVFPPRSNALSGQSHH